VGRDAPPAQGVAGLGRPRASPERGRAWGRRRRPGRPGRGHQETRPVVAGPPMSTPTELLAMARQLLERASPETAGLWPRAAALLGRQALEQAIDDFWHARKMPLESCPTRQQLICLREYLGDPDLAGRVHHAWQALSRASHHHPYELPPTAAELHGWIGE